MSSLCPKNYTCFKCKTMGDHWIMQCPKNVTITVSKPVSQSKSNSVATDTNEQQRDTKWECGHVKFFNLDKGYGFIIREKESDLFFHETDVVADPMKPLTNGDKVEFIAVKNQTKNKWNARCVKKINGTETDDQNTNKIKKYHTWRIWSGHEASFHTKLNEWKQVLQNDANAMLDFKITESFGDAQTLPNLLKALADTIGIYLNLFQIGFSYGCYSYPGSYLCRDDWCYIFSRCPNLTAITLVEAYTVDSFVMNCITKYCPKANKLNIQRNEPKTWQLQSYCEDCGGDERFKCRDHWIYVTFHRPDGNTETKSIAWCIDNGFHEVSPGLWSGSWYKKNNESTKSIEKKEESDEETESEEGGYDAFDEIFDYGGVPTLITLTDNDVVNELSELFDCD